MSRPWDHSYQTDSDSLPENFPAKSHSKEQRWLFTFVSVSSNLSLENEHVEKGQAIAD